jgi:hypothetical protein
MPTSLLHTLVDRFVAGLARKGKLFEEGFGEVDRLRAISAEIRDYTPERDAGVARVEWSVPEKNRLGVTIRRGTFESPLARLLPAEARLAHVELLLPKRLRGVCLLLAATAEEGFLRRRLFAGHLLRHGIGTLALESPLYGLRRPTGQLGPRIRTVAEHFALNLATVDEGRALLRFLRHDVTSTVGVSGFSQGGIMGGFVAALSRFPLAAVLRGAGDCALPVFTRDALTRVVDWPKLARDAGSRTAAQNLFAEVLAPVRISRHPVPVLPNAAILVYGRHDAFVVRHETEALARHWKGSELREKPAGHVTQALFYRSSHARAVLDAFDRLESHLTTPK